MKTELIPPDKKQCQCEKPNGNTFMTLGGRPGRVRCTNVPVVIVHETEPGADGLKGAMSLCAGCYLVFKRQVGLGKHQLKALSKEFVQ